MLKINIFWVVLKKSLCMRHIFFYGTYFVLFLEGHFLNCDILPVSNDPVLLPSIANIHIAKT